jgi:hypothetical protein
MRIVVVVVIIGMHTFYFHFSVFVKHFPSMLVLEENMTQPCKKSGSFKQN